MTMMAHAQGRKKQRSAPVSSPPAPPTQVSPDSTTAERAPRVRARENDEETEEWTAKREMEQAALQIMQRSSYQSEQVFDRCFRAHFGASLTVACFVWELLLREAELPNEATVERFLWACMLMKTYATEEVNCSKASGVDEQTFREWAWFFVFEISYLEPHVVSVEIRFSISSCSDCTCANDIATLSLSRLSLQIVWENRKCMDEGNDCLVSVDDTDCPYEADGSEWYAYKFKKTGLRYLVAICIKTGEIVYIDGPFPPGKGGLNDLATFRWGIMGWLDEGERVEADDGFLGESPKFVKCPKSFTRLESALKMQQDVRSRHEHVNKRLKQFDCLKYRFRHHDFSKHSACFRACAVFVQVSIEHGESLGDVEYSDALVVVDDADDASL